MHYAVIKRDGEFVEGALPAHVGRDRFCIMCAAAFGAGTTAHGEYGDEVREVVIKGETVDVIIVPWKRDLLAVIGTRDDLDEIMKKLKQ
jgi:predicted regulator of Ras-like GTPase activity (Roadblock/LC7/MglB family)